MVLLAVGWQVRFTSLFTAMSDLGKTRQTPSSQSRKGSNSRVVAPSPSLAAIQQRALAQVLGYALRLRGIRVQSRMGVSDVERAAAQELVVNVDIELGPELYPTTDELERAANYAEIVQIAAACAGRSAYRLLETFALQVANGLRERWPNVDRLQVSVTKARVPVAPTTDSACVEITLGRARS